MLRQHFAASIASSFKKADTSATKDAGIFVYEHQPLLAPRVLLKKSATPPACLAVSEWHIFAAQQDNAVVHVYSREKGTQEAIVPFPEKITSLALALDDTVLVLGTEGGRICLWEIYTGRSITGPQSHLQPVTALSVDRRSHYLLSGSADSNIHVWTISSLLSFTAPTNPSPLHTLSNHRGAITALAVGHSSTAANILISASKDDTVIVWDYHTSMLLATYLLGDTPLALDLDPADRGFYATYGDGSVQYVDFYVSGAQDAIPNPPISSLHDPSTSYTPIQPPKSTRWAPSTQDLGAALCISVSWDATTILTGHANGVLAAWSPNSPQHFKSTLATLPGPVTNVAFLAPSGFPNAEPAKYRTFAIVKPRLDLGTRTNDASGEVASPVPAGYGFNAQFLGELPVNGSSAYGAREKGGRKKTAFEEALTHTSFPTYMIEDSLAELRRAGSGARAAQTPSEPAKNADKDSDFMALDEGGEGDGDAMDINDSSSGSLEQQNKELREQVAALQRVQKATFKQLAELRESATKDGKRDSGSSTQKGDGAEEDEKEAEKAKRRERVKRALKKA
ncbi:WD40 repeat-like protein [Saccharata proteae CBS 121410]|uniref:Pre-rRNA-processing protein IPI3 n=1 Tax=Saccharata proteae CBS 121410 TaxID=1314787 RepID=A0A9P4I266_9PEZI|nr:WD40 repeat-like protein [Saccharata proteae CBS 121410]